MRRSRTSRSSYRIEEEFLAPIAGTNALQAMTLIVAFAAFGEAAANCIAQQLERDDALLDAGVLALGENALSPADGPCARSRLYVPPASRDPVGLDCAWPRLDTPQKIHGWQPASGGPADQSRAVRLL
jgi:hypothetical protein